MLNHWLKGHFFWLIHVFFKLIKPPSFQKRIFLTLKRVRYARPLFK